MLFMSCPPPIYAPDNFFIIETEVPIYCTIKRGEKSLRPKRLEAGKSVEVQCYDSIILSRDKEGTQAFYQVELHGRGNVIEDGIERSLVSRSTPIPPDYYFKNHLRYVYYGWDYKEGEKNLTYTLHVTKEMSESPLFYPSDFVINNEIQSDFYDIPFLHIYMVADNDLYSAAIETINQLESAYRGYGLVYIYLDAPKGTPYEGGSVLRLMYDESPQIKSKILTSFREVDSCDPKNFKKICESLPWRYPYPLTTLLWSHGTSWLPSFVNGDEINLTAFGKDESSNSSLDIEVVASATIGPIVFDSCRMASAEVFSCFEGRSIVAPSVDIEPLSYPYSDPEFLIALIYQQYEKVVDMIVDYNHKQSKEISMTYIKGKDIDWDNNFLEFFSDFYSYLSANYHSTNKLNFATMRSSLLPLGTTKPDKATLYYDLLSLIQEIEKGSGKTELADALKESIYVASTPTILNGQDSSKYCGVSCYVPYHYDEGISTELVQLNEYYLTLPWGATIGKYCKPLVPY